MKLACCYITRAHNAKFQQGSPFPPFQHFPRKKSWLIIYTDFVGSRYVVIDFGPYSAITEATIRTIWKEKDK